jgi:hypothetical protein
VRRASKWVMADGVVALVGAFVILLLPLDADGVSGSALRPHYRDQVVGISISGPLPDWFTASSLPMGGFEIPQDVVAHRRHVAELVGSLGAVVLAFGCAMAVAGKRRRANLVDDGAQSA